MAARNFQPLQMHRIKYTDLTEAQVLHQSFIAGAEGQAHAAALPTHHGYRSNALWETGQLRAKYIKGGGGRWQTAALDYLAS